MTLKRAREKREDARKLLADGIDPGNERKASAAAGADTFEAVAREWFAKQSSQWVPAHGERIIRRPERDVFPRIGSKPVAQVTAPDVYLDNLRERPGKVVPIRAEPGRSK